PGMVDRIGKIAVPSIMDLRRSIQKTKVAYLPLGLATVSVLVVKERSTGGSGPSFFHAMSIPPHGVLPCGVLVSRSERWGGGHAGRGFAELRAAVAAERPDRFRIGRCGGPDA